MNILTVYYSRTGNTRKIAEAINNKINGELEEIREPGSRVGISGYLKAGKDALVNAAVDIEEPSLNPADFDLVVIGGPVWAFTIAPPVRVYLQQYAGRLKKVAFFCTENMRGHIGAFDAMENSCGLAPVASLAVKQRDLKKETPNKLINNFIKGLD